MLTTPVSWFTTTALRRFGTKAIYRPASSMTSIGEITRGGPSLGLDSSQKVAPHATIARSILVPEDFVIPEPKPLVVADGNFFGALTGSLAAGVRGASGVFVLGWQATSQRKEVWPGTLGLLRDGSTMLDEFQRPTKPIFMWDNQADPQCALVREACSMLDLTVEVQPRNNTASTLLKNGDVSLSDASSAIGFLFDSYGPGRENIPWRLRGKLALLTARLASALRGDAGLALAKNARADRHLLQPLTLWGYEGSPFVRPVREALSALGLRHTIVHCAMGSANRDRLYRKTGRFQVPYLEDPNTGVSMFESGPMVKYLMTAYTTPEGQGKQGGESRE